MGRGKIEIKRIENENSRLVTFSKRRAGLIKKANELSILCEAEVAVIVFSNAGRLYEFANSSMKNILSRYQQCRDLVKGCAGEGEVQRALIECPVSELHSTHQREVDTLKGEVEKLKLNQLRLMGKDLKGMKVDELYALEQQLSEGLMCIKEKKAQMLMEELVKSRTTVQQAVMENKTLLRQAEEMKSFFPSSRYQETLLSYEDLAIEWKPVNEGYGSPETAWNGIPPDDSEGSKPVKEVYGSPEMAWNDEHPEDELEITLRLGLPSGYWKKMKTHDGGTQSSSS